MTQQLQEEYMCAACGFTTPVPNDACPSCGAQMDSLGPAAPVADESEESDDPHDINLTDEQIAAGNEDGTESLEALQEKEGEEDRAEYEHDSFGDE